MSCGASYQTEKSETGEHVKIRQGEAREHGMEYGWSWTGGTGKDSDSVQAETWGMWRRELVHHCEKESIVERESKHQALE